MSQPFKDNALDKAQEAIFLYRLARESLVLAADDLDIDVEGHDYEWQELLEVVSEVILPFRNID